MERNKEAVCPTCPYVGWNPTETRKLRCQRYPPKNGEPLPIVRDTFWCGEHPDLITTQTWWQLDNLVEMLQRLQLSVDGVASACSTEKRRY